MLQEIHVDWTALPKDTPDFTRAMFLTDAATGYVFVYFCKTSMANESARHIKNFVILLQNMYFQPMMFHSDNEIKSKSLLGWLERRGILVEMSAPNTPAQNGKAERSGGVVMSKARTMRIDANLPAALSAEIISAAVYLLNLTPRQGHDWKTPHELVRGWKSTISHLKTYGCKVFAMTPDAQLNRQRSAKLDPRAFIGFLVGYQSSNI